MPDRQCPNRLVNGTAVIAAVLFLWVAAPPRADAHRIRAALTTMVWQADTGPVAEAGPDTGAAPGSAAAGASPDRHGRFEITHRLHIHDAQFALNRVTGDPSASILDIEGQARLLLHVDAQFSMTVQDDAPMEIPFATTLIGAEVDGDYLFLYRESVPAPLPAALTVRDNTLRDVFPGQVNQVNVTVDGQTHSMMFLRDGTVRTARLRSDPPG